MINQAPSVYVVGVGAVTAVGLTAPASAAAVRAGIAALAEHPDRVDRVGEPLIVARASHLPTDVTGLERFLQLAEPAAREAAALLIGLSGSFQPIPMIVGLPAQRPGLPEALGDRVAERAREIMEGIGRVSDVETIASGHSAGLMAIEAGRRRIRERGVPFCLVGGVDSYLEPAALEWLEACEQIHGAGQNAWGFIPGEAAGFCLLASREAVDRHHLDVRLRVLEATTAREANLIKTESVCLGRGLTEAVRGVLQALPSPSARVDQTICDMNGEPYRADEYGFTIARTSQSFVSAGNFLAPADCWGDVGAASGPLFVGLAAAADRKGYSKGTYTLVWTSSEGGERSAALLEGNDPTKGGR